MNKKLAYILVLIGTLFSLSAGGGNDFPDGGGRQVLMWTFAQNNLDEWESRKLECERKFNIELTLKLVPQNGFIQKLQTVMLGGEGIPDIIEWMIENNRILSADPNRSFVHPLDDYVKNSALFQKVPAGRRSWITYGGHVYGLPHDVHPVVLIYNDTLWKEAGVDIAAIRDWDEFMAAGRKLIRKMKNGRPLHYALPSGDGGFGDSMWMIWQQTGAQLFDEAGNPTLTSDKLYAYIAKWLEWRGTGIFAEWEWGDFRELLINGKVCSYTSPDWWVSQVNAAVEDGAYQWRVRDLPLYPGGNGSRTSSWGGSFLAIPKTVQDLDFFFKLVEYMQYGNPDFAVLRYEWGGMLSPVPAAWDSPVFHRPDPRFGGQKLGELQVSLASESPAVNMTDVFWDALGYLNEEYVEMAEEHVTIEDGLENVQEKVLTRMQKLQGPRIKSE